MRSQGHSHRSIRGLFAVLFVASLLTFVQSFLVIKLACLGLFIIASIVDALRRERVAVYPRLLWFYLAIATIATIWAIVGWNDPANVRAGVADAVRLYVFWSIAFFVLYSSLRSRPSLPLLHTAMVTAGIAISAMNLFALYDQYAGLDLIPEAIRTELQLNIGFHDGYVHMASNSVGSLFLVVPYLMSIQFRADAGKTNTLATKVSLVFCLLVVALSGRRALWLVVALTPCMILLLSLLTKSVRRLRAGTRSLLAVYAIGPIIVLGLLMGGITSAFPEPVQELGAVRHLQAAFGADDERTIQKAYLLRGFARSPLMGSGFGGYANYLRSDDMPWTYELTYHQMLFNIGIVGVSLLASLILGYLVMVVKILTRFPKDSAIPFGLLVAFLALLIGSYSNPYLGSFAVLFFVGLLPYLSTFRRGFEEAGAKVAGYRSAVPHPMRGRRRRTFREAGQTS